jgi:hypothetical protein
VTSGRSHIPHRAPAFPGPRPRADGRVPSPHR